MIPAAVLLPRVLDALRQRTGLQVDEAQSSRIAELLDTASDAVATSTDPLEDEAVYDTLVDALTVDETYFFRHRHQLHFLRTEILPALLETRDPDHVLQLWSAGCANGAEPYTLAMILEEEGLARRAQVLGTDISAAAIEQARQARFSRWTRRSPELASRQRLFATPASTWATLSPDVVERVTLRQHNLLDDEQPSVGGGGFDVILCRNVLLHLTPEAVAAVVPRLVDALAPGGWLITAPADPPVLGLVDAGRLRPVTLPGGGLVHQRPEVDEPVASPAPPRQVRSHPPPPRRPRRVPRPREPRQAVSPTDEKPPTAADGRLRCRLARDLLAAGDHRGALAEASAAVILAPDLAMAHLTLGMAARQDGRLAVAARAFRHAGELLASLAPDTSVELADGETAGSLADMARAHALLAREERT